MTILNNTSARRTFFLSVLISAVASTPLSLGVVAAHWAGLAPAIVALGRPDTAIDLVRTFIVSFDLFTLMAWCPCALLIARLR